MGKEFNLHRIGPCQHYGHCFVFVKHQTSCENAVYQNEQCKSLSQLCPRCRNNSISNIEVWDFGRFRKGSLLGKRDFTTWNAFRNCGQLPTFKKTYHKKGLRKSYVFPIAIQRNLDNHITKG